jgi:hypothetical protein
MCGRARRRLRRRGMRTRVDRKQQSGGVRTSPHRRLCCGGVCKSEHRRRACAYRRRQSGSACMHTSGCGVAACARVSRGGCGVAACARARTGGCGVAACAEVHPGGDGAAACAGVPTSGCGAAACAGVHTGGCGVAACAGVHTGVSGVRERGQAAAEWRRSSIHTSSHPSQAAHFHVALTRAGDACDGVAQGEHVHQIEGVVRVATRSANTARTRSRSSRCQRRHRGSIALGGRRGEELGGGDGAKTSRRRLA